MRMLGLMQDWPLTLDKILDHARAWHGDREVVTRLVEGPIVRTTYAQMHERAKRASNALLELGVCPGDRVATMATNTARHLEAWYGIVGIGAVCHTLNPRLFVEQICYIINHAQDRVILTDATFAPMLAANRDKMPTVKHVVVLADEAHTAEAGLPGALSFETLLAKASPDCAWGGFDERTAAGLCYTSGTTGNPKGVLYSHRSNFLHTIMTLSPDLMAISALDVVMAVVPMCHANGWGLIYSAPAAGAKLVLPGPKLDAPSLYEMLEGEGVTFAAGVPTIWQLLLQHVQTTGGRFSTLKRVHIGGSAVPEALIRTFQEDYGVTMTQAWGMTELSPTGVTAKPSAPVAAMDRERQYKQAAKQGRPPVLLEMKITDDEGRRLPQDGSAFGRYKVKGPYVASQYYLNDAQTLDEEGFFDTGDVASIDPFGYLNITDRAKDVIKSGGEWISSVEIENLAASHPKALMAAVIGVAHPKWDERPLLLVRLREGESATKAEFLDFLDGKIARWWTPDEVLFVDDIPLGATGKIDKKVIRERYQDFVLPQAAAPPPPETPAAPAKEEAAAGAGRPFPAEPRKGAATIIAGLAAVAAGLALLRLLRLR
jgi:fatty-acyl-CoA synthase